MLFMDTAIGWRYERLAIIGGPAPTFDGRQGLCQPCPYTGGTCLGLLPMQS